MDEKIDEAAMNIIKVYLAQMNSAVKISEIICKHEKKDTDEITGDHIISGLVYRLMNPCLLYTSPSPRDGLLSRMPSSA